MANETFTLLVWESVPERTDLYLVPDAKIDTRLRKVLDRANTQMVNAGGDDDGALVVNHLLMEAYPPENDGRDLLDWDETWLGLFQEYKFAPKGKLPSAQLISHIYSVGFLL